MLDPGESTYSMSRGESDRAWPELAATFWWAREVSMRHHAGWVGLLLGALPVLAGCGGPLNPDLCHNIRLAVVSPDPAVLQVGQEVTLQAQLLTGSDCLPSDAQPGNLRWASEDPIVATSDSMSGRVRGIKAGGTLISLTTSVTHTFLTTSSVQVVGP